MMNELEMSGGSIDTGCSPGSAITRLHAAVSCVPSMESAQVTERRAQVAVRSPRLHSGAFCGISSVVLTVLQGLMRSFAAVTAKYEQCSTVDA